MQIGAVGGFSTSTNRIKMDPDKYAQQYAAQNGISVEEAKEKLKTQFGDPQNTGGVNKTQSFGQTESESTEDVSEAEKAKIASQLRALGIPDNIIQQGPQAVGDYAKEHDIKLPELSSNKQSDNFTGQTQLADLNRFFILKKNAA